jgi:hypothetical protein
MQLHTAIIGTTGSGKTHLARNFAAIARAGGVSTLILHKPREIWPQNAADWQTDDPARYQSMFWRAKGCFCVMELADADVDKWDREFHKCFSQGRHEGHRCVYVSQYGPQVHPIIRINCDALALFATNKRAAATWAEEFNDERLMLAANLKPREFFWKPSRFDPARLLTLAG